MKILSWLTIAAGLFLALFGLLLDYILSSSEPGIGLPQLLIAFAGLGMVALGLFLQRVKKQLPQRGHLGKGILVTLVTLIAIELALAVAGYATYYPSEEPETYKEIVDWFHCDATLGCRFNHHAAQRACETGELTDLLCVFNPQGFADHDEFVASEELAQRNRVLVLGDSFTHGFSADVGFSYVDVIEKALPDIALWNLGISATGTNQALASFAGIAPIMQPQLTILGFFVGNDFSNNRFELGKTVIYHGRRSGVMTTDYALEDRWGLSIYEVDPMTALRYSSTNRKPPPNELEHLVGLTRLGAVLLSSMDAMSPIFDGVKWTARVAETRVLLQQLLESTAKIDSQLLVLIIPAKEDFPTKTERYTTAIDLMRDLSIPYLEVINKLSLTEDYQAANDIHWNNRGHRIVGEILADYIDGFFSGGDDAA